MTKSLSRLLADHGDVFDSRMRSGWDLENNTGGKESVDSREFSFPGCFDGVAFLFVLVGVSQPRPEDWVVQAQFPHVFLLRPHSLFYCCCHYFIINSDSIQFSFYSDMTGSILNNRVWMQKVQEIPSLNPAALLKLKKIYLTRQPTPFNSPLPREHW